MKRAECWRINVLLENILESPLDCKKIKSANPILKEMNPEYSFEGLMLKLKLRYFGHLMRRADSLEKTLSWERLKAGAEGNDRGWDGWMASLSEWTWVWESSGKWWRTGKPGVVQSMGSQRVWHDWATEQQQNITYTMSININVIYIHLWYKTSRNIYFNM